MQAKLRSLARPGSIASALAPVAAIVFALALVLVASAPAAAQSGVLAPASEHRIEQLSEDQLKDFYVGCTGASLRGLLGSSHIALCSVGYQRLLERHFGGDFDAFLAWSRSQDRAIDALAATGAQPPAGR